MVVPAVVLEPALVELEVVPAEVTDPFPDEEELVPQAANVPATPKDASKRMTLRWFFILKSLFSLYKEGLLSLLLVKKEDLPRGLEGLLGRIEELLGFLLTKEEEVGTA